MKILTIENFRLICFLSIHLHFKLIHDCKHFRLLPKTSQLKGKLSLRITVIYWSKTYKHKCIAFYFLHFSVYIKREKEIKRNKESDFNHIMFYSVSFTNLPFIAINSQDRKHNKVKDTRLIQADGECLITL